MGAAAIRSRGSPAAPRRLPGRAPSGAVAPAGPWPAPFAGQQAPPVPQGWQPGYGQHPPYAPQAGNATPAPRPARKNHHIFMWVFLAIQALFLIWIITGVVSHPAGPSAATQAAQQCANGGWQGLFKSQADCDQHYAVALNDAGNVGKGLGVALIVVFWCVVDFLMGITYLIVRLERRRA